MKNRHRVVWTQGMFLTPQHFQTQEQFLEDAVHFRFDASHYANWGVTKLNIDSEALANGLFRLDTCGGVMPDGEPVDIPETDEAPPSRGVADHFPPNRESLDVFLAISGKSATGPQRNRSGSGSKRPTQNPLSRRNTHGD
jgi:type VI secretion system protein ImpJ